MISHLRIDVSPTVDCSKLHVSLCRRLNVAAGMEFSSPGSSSSSRHTVIQAWLADVVAAGEPLTASSSSSSTPQATSFELHQDTRPAKRSRPLTKCDYSPVKRQRTLHPVHLNVVSSSENERSRSFKLSSNKAGAELHQDEIENQDLVEDLTKEEAPRLRNTTIAARIKRTKTLPASTFAALKPPPEHPQSESIESRLTLDPNYEKLVPFDSQLLSELPDQSSSKSQYATALTSASASADTQPTLPKSVSSGATSSRRPRSTSPVKRMADLQFADMQTCYKEFEDVESQLPGDASRVYNDLDAFGQGIGVVPLKVKVSLSDPFNRCVHTTTFFRAIREATKREKVFSVAFMGSDNETPEEQLLKEFREVIDIQAASRTCAQDHDSEPGWNDEVHSRVLRLAFQPKAGVGYKNM